MLAGLTILCTWVGPWNRVVGGAYIPSREGAVLGHFPGHCKVQGICSVSCAKTNERIEMPFGGKQTNEAQGMIRYEMLFLRALKS